MKLTTVAAALAATLALAQTAHAREHHYHRQGVYQGVYHRGVYQQGVYHYGSRGSAWSADNQWHWNRREDWSAWNTAGSQPAYYRRGSRQAFAWSARAARYGRVAHVSGANYRTAYRCRSAAHDGEERTAAYRGVLGARPSAWCGWEMRQLVGRDPGPEFNQARRWAQWGHAGPAGIGAVVVWPHHVGLIVGRENGQWIVKSGNDGNRVRTRLLPISNAIAIRWGQG